MLVKNRKFTDLRVVKNEFMFCVQNNYRAFLISGILFFLWTFFSILSKKNFYEQQIHVGFCRLDGYVVMDTIVVKALVLFPVALYLFSIVLTNTSAQLIIRKRSRKSVLDMQKRSMIFLSLYLMVVEAAVITLVGAVFCEVDGNWTQDYSVFWYEMEHILAEMPNYANVILQFCFSSFLDYRVLGYLYLLIGYCCGKKYFAYLSEVVLAVCLFGLRDHINLDGIRYEQWILWSWSPYLWKIVCLTGLSFACRRMITRKDFDCK